MDNQIKIKDDVLAEGAWKFDEKVASCFDDMLGRSIPQYEVMRGICYEVGRKFVRDGSTIMDLGASRGEAIARFIAEFGKEVSYCAVEISEPMLKAMENRFLHYQSVEYPIQILKHDLRNGVPEKSCSLIMCVLTLQFTPIEYRLKIMRSIYKNLLPGGAVIFVEKVIGNGAELDELLVELYLQMKKRNGYTDEEISRKRLSLEGVLVPLTSKWNEELLSLAGFSYWDCIWRYLNFSAWVAVK